MKTICLFALTPTTKTSRPKARGSILFTVYLIIKVDSLQIYASMPSCTQSQDLFCCWGNAPSAKVCVRVTIQKKDPYIHLNYSWILCFGSDK